MVYTSTENLFLIASNMACELDSLYQDNKFGRRAFLEFMDSNGWFGVEYTMIKKVPVVKKKSFRKFREPLMLWLSAYKKPGRDKIDLMLRHFDTRYPETCRLYREFIWGRQLYDEPSAWKLLDYLLCEIDGEITTYSEADIEKLIKKVDTDATLSSARLFAEFLTAARHKDRVLTKWSYSFGGRETPGIVIDAYPLADYAVMAYCVFNEEMWSKQKLIEKAMAQKQYADLWLFVALHFICALRKTDMVRLPAPALPYDTNIVLKMIEEQSFSKKEASLLSEEWGIRIKLKPMKPSKTSMYEKVPELSLFVPESLKAPLGVIIALALTHRPEIIPGDCFVVPSCNLPVIRGFFGKEFVASLGNGQFSSRRANKSYLQGIDTIGGSDNAPGKPKGYMLAALARSHKSGIGSLSKTTDIYLRDARFSGYSPEFIIQQMFERGVFSFIPAILLEMYAGPSYISLPVVRQTELIGCLGLAAHQIEQTADMVNRALIKSRKAVHEILQAPLKIKDNIFNLLQNIASGNAPSRQREYLCLMTAAGFSCPCADRDGCIGCGYEIYTKTAMHTLMKEYAYLTTLKNSANNSETWRYERILEQAILPAVAEMLSAMKLLYPESDLDDLLDIMEKGLGYDDCDT